MTEHVIIAVFKVKSEAYQALSQIRQDAVTKDCIFSQAALVENKDGRATYLDGFDTGVETRNDTAVGGLIGALIGILGGPIGMLLGGGYGVLLGSVVDAGDLAENVSVIEHACGTITEGETALVALVQENGEGAYRKAFEGFQVELTALDAAEVEQEVEHAREVEREMEKEARRKFRAEKKEDYLQKIDQAKQNIRAQFERIREKHSL